MAANVVRGLLVKLGLDAVEYTQGLTRAELQAKRTLENISRSAAGVANTLKGIGAAFGVSIGVGAFVHLIKSTIDAAEHLENLSKSTGIAVETLGGLGFAATQTGSSLDGMASAFKKFNVNIAQAAAGNKEQLENFDALGITLQDLQKLKPDEIFIKAAAAFHSFEEGANKSARGSIAFGKAYQDILPTLDQGAAKLQQNIAYFARYGGVTADVARDASEFNSELTKLNLLAGSFARTLTAELLGPLRVLIGYLVDGKEKGDQFAGVAKKIGEFMATTAIEVSYLAQGFEHLARASKSLQERIDAFKRFDFSGGFGLGMKGEQEEIDAINKRYAELRINIRAAGRDREVFGGDLPTGAFPGKRPVRPLPSKAGAGAGGAADDPTRKQLEAALAALRANSEQEQAVLSNRNQYLQSLYDQGYLSTSDFYTKKQAAQEEDLRRTTEDYAEQIALIDRFIAQAKTATDRAQGEKDKVAATARQRLAIIQAAGKAQQTLDEQVARRPSDVQAQYSNVQQAIAIAQARIDLQAQTGAITEIEALNRRADVARAYISTLSALADAYEKIANDLNVDAPKRAEALLQVARYRLEIDQLAASASVLAKRFDDILIHNFADGLADAATGAKTLKQAILDMERSIVQSIARIAAQNLTEKLFGGSGPASGFGSLLAKLFGGGAGLGAGWTSGFDLPMGSFSSGTNYARGGMALVGERGPEIINVPRGSEVIPNNKIGNEIGNVINLHITVPGNTSRASADQIALATGAAVRRAMRSIG